MRLFQSQNIVLPVLFHSKVFLSSFFILTRQLTLHQLQLSYWRHFLLLSHQKEKADIVWHFILLHGIVLLFLGAFSILLVVVLHEFDLILKWKCTFSWFRLF